MERYIVCDYYHPDTTINIDAVCASFEEAQKAMSTNINQLLSTHGYYLNDGYDAVPFATAKIDEDVSVVKCSEHNVTLTIDDEIICDWFIKTIDVPLTSMEREQIFREVQHDYRVEDVKNYFEEHEEEF